MHNGAAARAIAEQRHAAAISESQSADVKL
jgi:hypothetical protein